MSDKIQCVKCTKVVCNTKFFDKNDANCPTHTRIDIVDKVKSEYKKPEIREFARQAIFQHNEAILHLPEGGVVPRNPRVEEVAQFAKKMEYKKLGVVFCAALRHEAQLLDEILENRGFDVVSLCCMAGGLPVEELGIKDDQKIAGPGTWQSMCNPIVQAEILNEEKVDFNVLVGLCVGHDSLFFKYAQAPTTVLIVKDRVFGNNPVAALHEAKTFYRWLKRKEKP
ncbi:DUF1847 domain-containing protein [Spirochaetota bacterium]